MSRGKHIKCAYHWSKPARLTSQSANGTHWFCGTEPEICFCDQTCHLPRARSVWPEAFLSPVELTSSICGRVDGKYILHVPSGMLHCSFQNLLQTGSQSHNYFTRNAESYGSHDCRTNIKQFTILYKGPKLWSSFPYSITQSNNLRSFKHSLKVYLILSQKN